MKVFFGTRVVKVVSFADSRPSASFATACTLYWVPADRWAVGCQLAPSAAIFPSTAVPLESATVTVVSLPCWAVTLRAPLVATDSAPSFGRIVTTAWEAAFSCLPSPWACGPRAPPVASPPPPPQAVSTRSSAPAARARNRTPPRRRPLPVVPAGAPDIGCPFTVVVSPRTARQRHGPTPVRIRSRTRR